MNISIIVCTRNRDYHLRQTLAAMSRILIPLDSNVELLVIDNGSIDQTHQVVQRCGIRQMTVRHIFEPQKGQAHARNRGLAQATGEIILFTDDDVRPSKKWMEGMCAPICDKQADAVAGSIVLPTHLQRSWMNPVHQSYLASNEAESLYRIESLIGASMGFSRRVLERVPMFDPELGPGALGFRDDVLFSRQLLMAGYRVTRSSDHPVMHHIDPARLSRAAFLDRAKRDGRSHAYVVHHWYHDSIRFPQRTLVACFLRLTVGQLKRRGEWPHEEGAPVWELLAIRDLHFLLGYLKERRRPRNYAKHGLVKLSALAPDAESRC